jgi:hypothetical protein
MHDSVYGLLLSPLAGSPADATVSYKQTRAGGLAVFPSSGQPEGPSLTWCVAAMTS